MAYEKQVWQDHIVERPRTFTESQNGDGSKTFTPAPGQIIQQGSPQNAQRFNHMEDGIAKAALDADSSTEALKTRFFGNQNILMNADFRNPVNQRGEEVYNVTQNYTIDRWIASKGIVKVQSGALRIKKNSAENMFFYQKIEKTNLKGKTITISIQFEDGSIDHKTITVPLDGHLSNVVLGNVHVFTQEAGENYSAGIMLDSDAEIGVARIKIEHGTHSTMHLDPVQDYSTEYMRCARYYNKMHLFAPVGYILGEIIYFTAPVRFPVPMRIAPTVSINSAAIYRIADVNFLSGNSSVNKEGISWLSFAKPLNAPESLTSTNYLECKIEFFADM